MSNRIIVGINCSNYGCTGRICDEILEVANIYGYETYMACALDHISKNIKKINQIYIGNRVSRNIHQIIYKYTGYFDYGSFISTKKFLKKLDKIKPDIIHLHVVHSNYVNLRLLMKYIRKNNIGLVWTMHDCWAFTGRCAYFQMNGCNKWLYGCGKCEFKEETPKAYFFDRSKQNLLYKEKIFKDIKSFNIVTPSKWLSELARMSFLNNVTIQVINNGIDLDYFKPVESNFKSEYNLENKTIILAVAVEWGIRRKGFEYISYLSNKISDEFVIVLVGRVSENQKEKLKDNVIVLGTVQDSNKLMQIYTCADVFVNTTLDDNFPTTNIEALACGTPVVTFDTGGSAEAINEKCGYIVAQKDKVALVEAINKIREKKPTREECINQAKLFSKKNKYKEYVNLYNNILKNKDV